MKFLLSLLLAYSLQAAGFWTLTGLEKANIYVANKVDSLEKKSVTKIKQKIYSALEEIGVKTKMQDSPTLMLSLKEISNESMHYVYIKLALGEEVQTLREEKNGAFALTYESSDFIAVTSQNLEKEILKSVDFLLVEFSEHFEDDKE